MSDPAAEPLAARVRWAQVPGARNSRSWAWPWVAWLVAAASLTAGLEAIDYPARHVRPAVLLMLPVLLVAERFRLAWMPIGVAVVVAVRIISPSLPPVAIALLVALMLACFAVTGRWPRDRTRVSPVARVLAIVLVVAATAVLVARGGLRLPAVLALASLAVSVAAAMAATRRTTSAGPSVVALRPSWATRLFRSNQRFLLRVGRPLGTAVGALVMLPGAVLAVVGWSGQSLARFDPLAPPTAPWTRWVTRAGEDATASRSFSTSQARDPRGAARTARAIVAGMPTLAVIAAVIVLLSTLSGTHVLRGAKRLVVPDDTPPVTPQANGAGVDKLVCPKAQDGPNSAQPGWQDLSCEQARFVHRLRFDPLTTYSFADASGRYVNVEHSIRRTWHPPACTTSCRRLKVWWFGASSAWGWNQRDEYTLPSQLAKVASDHGLTLDITNYATPAWVLDQEVRKFEELTLTSPERPDMVIFYDGGNELNRQKERNGRGRAGDESATSSYEAEIDDFLWNGPNLPDAKIWNRGSGWPIGPHLEPAEIATHAMNRYRRDIVLGQRAAQFIGIEPVFVWQPLAASSPPAASTADVLPPIDVPIWKAMIPQALRELPAGVIDLSHSLDSVTTPVFDDVFHTNEAAADLVAKALFDRVQPRLAAAARAH